ncbi:MAG: hypothetical protein LBP62_04245 [Clostridiales bacterium]|jgi:hypothetical protein|nr:hypothetical protein [Clostridiales bacterium]
MIISDENKAFLEKEIENFQELFDKNDIDEILSELNFFLTSSKCLDDEYYPTPYGDKAQRIYDEILYDNYENE